MATNSIPQSAPRRIRLAQSLIAGLTEHGDDLQITRVPAAVLQATLDNYTSARAAAAPLKTGQSNARQGFNGAVAAAIAYGSKARRHLLDLLGSQPNALWLEAGFAAGSTAAPRDKAHLVTFLDTLALFFKNHPENALAVKNLTENGATAISAAITNSETAFRSATTAYNSAKTAAEAAFKALGAKMSDAVAELKLALGPDDEIWHDFGLRRPADPETPEIPRNLHLETSGAGRIWADWDDAPGADRYHVFLQRPGDTVAARVLTADDSEAMLADLPTGATVKISVRAVNAAGESALCEPMEIVVA